MAGQVGSVYVEPTLLASIWTRPDSTLLPSNRLLRYGSVARRVAVLQKVLSCARRHAVCRPKLSGATSASMVDRHVLRGLPRCRTTAPVPRCCCCNGTSGTRSPTCRMLKYIFRTRPDPARPDPRVDPTRDNSARPYFLDLHVHVDGGGVAIRRCGGSTPRQFENYGEVVSEKRSRGQILL